VKCEICKAKKVQYLVSLLDAKDEYKYKNTYRCEDCAERALRSYENVEIRKV
jgi:superfamily II helicase